MNPNNTHTPDQNAPPTAPTQTPEFAPAQQQSPAEPVETETPSLNAPPTLTQELQTTPAAFGSSLPASLPQAQPPVQPVAPVIHPVQTQSEQSMKYAKRIEIIAIVTIALGVLNGISQFFANPELQFSFGTAMALGQIVVGLGLYRRYRTAYIIFNVLAAFTILGGLIALSGLVYVLPILLIGLNSEPIASILSLLLVFLLSLASTAFYLFAVIWLHPKAVRQLLH